MRLTIPPKSRTQPLTVWLLPRHIEKLTMIRDTTGLSFGQLLRALIDQAEVSEGQQDDNNGYCLSDKL